MVKRVKKSRTTFIRDKEGRIKKVIRTGDIDNNLNAAIKSFKKKQKKIKQKKSAKKRAARRKKVKKTKKQLKKVGKWVDRNIASPDEIRKRMDEFNKKW